MAAVGVPALGLRDEAGEVGKVQIMSCHGHCMDLIMNPYYYRGKLFYYCFQFTDKKMEGQEN